MARELIPGNKLGDSGQVFIPTHRFVSATQKQIADLEKQLQEIIESNPEHVFWIEEHWDKSGKTIRWERRNVHRADEESPR